MAENNPKNLDDITAEWLTYALRQGGTLTDSSVKNIAVEPMAQGKAWLSRILKIKSAYDPPNTTAPKSFVLKLLLESPQFRDAAYEIGAYEREIKFYKEVAPTIPIRLPKLIYSDYGPDSNLMLMEDLSYISPADQIEAINRQQVLTTLKSLAKVHAAYWDNEEIARLNWLPITNNIEEEYADNWESFVELCGYFIDPAGLKIGEKLISHISWLREEIESRPRTVVHDDMKADNLLFGEAGTDEAVVILDWQFAIRSMGAIDVARLVGGSMISGQRSGFQFEALRCWYDKLLEDGVQGYSWQEAQRDFRLGSLSCLTFPVKFHKGIVRAEGRALEYVKALYSRLFLFAVEIDADSVLL